MLYHEERLNQVHPTLARIVWLVSLRKSCFLVYGYRGQADQDKAFATGHSKLKFPNSWHNTMPSCAVDLCPVNSKGNPDWSDSEGFKQLYLLMNLYAKLSGVKIVAGADWKSPVDLAHFQLRDRAMAEKPYTDFPLKKTCPDTWLPSDANMWLYNKNRQAGYPATAIKPEADAAGYDWAMLVAVGAVTSEWFSQATPDTDLFHCKIGGSIGEQAHVAVTNGWTNYTNVGDLPDFTDEQKRQICLVYTQLTAYLESLAAVRKPKPLPVPPPPEQPKPVPPKPTPTPLPPLPEDPKPAPGPVKNTWAWVKTVVTVGAALSMGLKIASVFFPSLILVTKFIDIALAALQALGN